MSEYDSIFKDKNVNTPLFLRIEIIDYIKTKNLTISVPSNGTYKTGSKSTAYTTSAVWVGASGGTALAEPT